MRVLEYIIRALDRTGDGTNSAKKNVSKMADDIEGASGRARAALIGLAAKAALVLTAFKTGWEIGKKINEWISPTLRLARAWEDVSKQVERAKKWISEKSKETTVVP